jgi:DNA-binding transcriptional ArsR family regulator
VSDAIWAALADPHRRAVLDLLRREGGCTVGRIVDELGASQPATSKHLRVLREAGMVQVHKDAQRRVYMVDPEAVARVDAWLEPYRKLWSESLDALDRRLDATAGHLDTTRQHAKEQS